MRYPKNPLAHEFLHEILFLFLGGRGLKLEGSQGSKVVDLSAFRFLHYSKASAFFVAPWDGKYTFHLYSWRSRPAEMFFSGDTNPDNKVKNITSLKDSVVVVVGFVIPY